VSSPCEVSGLLTTVPIVAGVGLILLAAALGFDYRGLRTRQIRRDLQPRRWLYERHLWFKDERPYPSKWFMVAGTAAFMGVVVIATGVEALIAC